LLRHVFDALIAYGPLGVFLLTLLDSLGLPLPWALDAFLIVVAWKTPDRAWLTAGLATAGSLFGNMGLFWAARGGARRWVRAVPEPDRPQRFRKWFRRYGLITVFIPALFPIPMPLKVFVISAGMFHTPFVRFVGIILAARMLRFFGEAYIGMRLGENGPRFLQANAVNIIVVALVVAAALFLAVHLSDRRRNATIL
jgi:membrane protein YqaA with SNARE-associated domain